MCTQGKQTLTEASKTILHLEWHDGYCKEQHEINAFDLIDTTITFWAMAYVISISSCIHRSLIECLFVRKEKKVFGTC